MTVIRSLACLLFFALLCNAYASELKECAAGRPYMKNIKYDIPQYCGYKNTKCPKNYFCREPVKLESYCCLIKPCDASPCYNGGTCLGFTSMLYFCLCDVGWTGSKCQSLRKMSAIDILKLA